MAGCQPFKLLVGRKFGYFPFAFPLKLPHFRAKISKTEKKYLFTFSLPYFYSSNSKKLPCVTN